MAQMDSGSTEIWDFSTASNSVEIWGFYSSSIGYVIRAVFFASVCFFNSSFDRCFTSKSQIFNFKNNWRGCHFDYNFFLFLNLFFWKVSKIFKNLQNTIKDCILPIQNHSNFHIKIEMLNSQASFNVNFSFKCFNNFDWFRASGHLDPNKFALSQLHSSTLSVITV